MLVISLQRLWETALRNLSISRLFLFLSFQKNVFFSATSPPSKASPSLLFARGGPVNWSLLRVFRKYAVFPEKFTHPGTPPSFLSFLLLLLLLLRWMGGRVEKRRGPRRHPKKKRSDFSFSCLYAASAMWSLKVLKTWEAPEGIRAISLAFAQNWSGCMARRSLLSGARDGRRRRRRCCCLLRLFVLLCSFKTFFFFLVPRGLLPLAGRCQEDHGKKRQYHAPPRKKWNGTMKSFGNLTAHFNDN